MSEEDSSVCIDCGKPIAKGQWYGEAAEGVVWHAFVPGRDQPDCTPYSEAAARRMRERDAR